MRIHILCHHTSYSTVTVVLHIVQTGKCTVTIEGHQKKCLETTLLSKVISRLFFTYICGIKLRYFVKFLPFASVAGTSRTKQDAKKCHKLQLKALLLQSLL